MTLADPIWKNPYQRFGFIHANVVISEYVRLSDIDLFFGPMHPEDLIVEVIRDRVAAYRWKDVRSWLKGETAITSTVVERAEQMDLSKLFALLGIFESAKDAQRHGFKKPIPEGFSDTMRIKKMHRVTVLKITKPEDDYDFERASQEAPCEACGKRLGSHPLAEGILVYQDLPYLNRDCLGNLWKL